MLSTTELRRLSEKGDCSAVTPSMLGQPPKQTKGFTLIEILLVIVLIAVISAIVAPSFFAASGRTVAQEARLMQKMLRMASEESQLSGRPLLLEAYRDHISLRSRDTKGKWQPLVSDVLDATYRLNAPVHIVEATLDGSGMIKLPDISKPSDRKKTPLLSRFLLMPDGNLTAGRVTLSDGDRAQSISVLLQPGPAGIVVDSQS